MSYVQWCPFIYNVQNNEDTFLYSSLDGKNIIKFRNSEFNIIYKKQSECVIHFSVSTCAKTIFFAGLSNKIYICENDKITEMDIHNSIEERLVPYIYDNRVRAIGCVSSRVFELFDDGMKIINDFQQSGEWFVRGNVEEQYICMWDNMQKKIMLINTTYSNALIIPWFENSIIDVIESNGYLYVLYGKNKLSIYDYHNKTIMITVNIDEKYAMQKIVLFKKDVFLFAETGNSITKICFNTENMTQEVIKIDLDKDVHAHWKDLGNGNVLGIIESCNFKKALVIKLDLNNNCMNKIPIYSSYCQHIMHEKDYAGIIEETEEFGLNDFIKNF